MAEQEAIAITGLGLVLATGRGRASADAVFAGRSAVNRLDVEGFPNAVGAACRSFAPPDGTQGCDRAVSLAADAADQAWAEADPWRVPSERIGVVFPLSKGGIPTLAAWATQPGQGGWANALPDAAARCVADRLGARGPVLAPVSACASGGHAMLWAARLLGRGHADIVVCGVAEASLHPLILGSYSRMGVLAHPGSDPAACVRPFSASRRGFALGEGAAALVLERTGGAARRGVSVLAMLVGWASGSHATSPTAVEANGASEARVASLALGRARVAPSEVDFVAAHGTGTPAGDLAEARAIHGALGPAAGQASVASTKGVHGHLLGAAMGVETALAVLAIERQSVPPTANLTDPDPAIGLDCTPLVARARPVRHVLKLGTGFGGHTVALVLAAPN